MIKGRWQAFVDSLKQGAFKFAHRRLEEKEIQKFERLVEEQRRLAEKLSKTFEDYEIRLNKIAALFEECRQGELERLMPHIQHLQEELRTALTKADLAVSEHSDLRREMTDWNRRKEAGLSDEPERLRCLMSELELRGRSGSQNERPLTPSLAKEGEQGGVRQLEADHEPTELEPEEPKGAIYYTDSAANYLEHDVDHLVWNIRELSRELARYQQSPDVESAESLRLARQIKDLHALLRKADRLSGAKRDRLETTDGFRHVFSSH